MARSPTGRVRLLGDSTLDHDFTRSVFQGGLGAPIDGVLQEYRAFDEHGLLHIPKHLTWEEAACIPCAGVTAWNALYGGIPLIAGQTVLLQGTGGVSMFGLILAHAAGAKVDMTCRISTPPLMGCWTDDYHILI